MSRPLPVILETGDDWTGFMRRREALKNAGEAILYCGVEHTLAKKPVMTRINPAAVREPNMVKKPKRPDL